MKTLRKIYYKLFPTFKRLELQCMRYDEADQLIKRNIGKAPEQQWDIAKEEDTNTVYGIVYLERKIRITQ